MLAILRYVGIYLMPVIPRNQFVHSEGSSPLTDLGSIDYRRPERWTR